MGVMESTERGPSTEEAIQILGTFKAGKIVVADEKQVNWLSERGYGTKDGGITLSIPEALFLMETKRLEVLIKGKKKMTFEQLLRSAMRIDKNIWHKYLILRDLRSRGYVAQEGYGLGVDFNVYDKGDFPTEPPKFLVVGLSEGTPTKFADLINILRRAQSNRKVLILAVIDRRNEVVYYSISKL